MDLRGGLPGSGRKEGRVTGGTGNGGYHCTSRSKPYSGDGCATASQSGTALTGRSSQAGGPRAGAIQGGSAGSPMWLRDWRARGVPPTRQARRTGYFRLLTSLQRTLAWRVRVTALGRQESPDAPGSGQSREASGSTARGRKPAVPSAPSGTVPFGGRAALFQGLEEIPAPRNRMRSTDAPTLRCWDLPALGDAMPVESASLSRP